jgi:hypothetical protein
VFTARYGQPIKFSRSPENYVEIYLTIIMYHPLQIQRTDMCIIIMNRVLKSEILLRKELDFMYVIFIETTHVGSHIDVD